MTRWTIWLTSLFQPLSLLSFFNPPPQSVWFSFTSVCLFLASSLSPPSFECFSTSSTTTSLQEQHTQTQCKDSIQTWMKWHWRRSDVGLPRQLWCSTTHHLPRVSPAQLLLTRWCRGCWSLRGWCSRSPRWTAWRSRAGTRRCRSWPAWPTRERPALAS